MPTKAKSTPVKKVRSAAHGARLQRRGILKKLLEMRQLNELQVPVGKLSDKLYRTGSYALGFEDAIDEIRAWIESQAERSAGHGRRGVGQ